MKLKEFFRPTWGKIILTLFIPAFYSQIGQTFCYPCHSGEYCPPCNQPFLFMPLILAIFSFINYPHQDIQYLILFFLIGLVLSYTISCIIIFFFKKLRNKN
ncbi:MAG: hypothetical protein Q7S33_02305 [Nanoarchaeota archaeon]|nr:hypothetical protein [Nanoarchaeota archaeon]